MKEKYCYDFNKNSKGPLIKRKDNTNAIQCATVLKNGKFATGSNAHSIIIYNNKTYEIELIIYVHDDFVLCLTQLSSGILASSSGDNTIKLFQEKTYKVIQTLNYHKDRVYKIIELNNKKLVSCSWDNSLIIYSPYHNKFRKDYQIKTKGYCSSVIQTKENEICYSEYNAGTYSESIYFYDLLEKKIIDKKDHIGCNCSHMISKDLLLLIEFEKLIVINVNTYNILKKIKVPESGNIYASCMLDKHNFIFGDQYSNIQHWRIEADNLKLISIKKNAHDNWIYTLLLLKDGHILSGDSEGEIKIW